jgi:hypothetical protein
MLHAGSLQGRDFVHQLLGAMGGWKFEIIRATWWSLEPPILEYVSDDFVQLSYQVIV